jgi:ubiquinone/menaquinone biosynthesis methyltransferase
MPSRPHAHEANAAEFSSASDDVFGRIAGRYDLLCDLFSLGIHRLWKRRVARHIAREPWTCLFDAASGTGDVVLRVARDGGGAGQRVIASDLSTQMLAVARRRAGTAADSMEFRVMDACNLAGVADASVDLYSISLGLKICERGKVLREALRVLRPGGRLVTLEASNIAWAPLHRAYLAYMRLCMPLIGYIATGGDASAYRYLLKGVEDFPGAEALAREMEELGFTEVAFERLSLGIVAIHTARKPL